MTGMITIRREEYEALRGAADDLADIETYDHTSPIAKSACPTRFSLA